MMRNSFERFGIGHLSPSSLNLWRASPGVWALRYIGKIKDEGKAAMWRGSAVEVGLAALLHGENLPYAVHAAHMSFDLNATGNNNDEEIEHALIEPMLAQCAKWKWPSSLNATQLKVEHWFDPVPIPVIGYLDFAFDGIDIDLKTTKACPSTPRADNVRQVALYRAARGRAGGLLYVTDKRHAYYEVTDEMMDEALLEMSAAALSLNNFLSRMDTREDVLRSLPVDYEYFAAPKTKVPLADILTAG
jgi:hypothetical protein